jgi:hypothetical protein
MEDVSHPIRPLLIVKIRTLELLQLGQQIWEKRFAVCVMVIKKCELL